MMFSYQLFAKICFDVTAKLDWQVMLKSDVCSPACLILSSQAMHFHHLPCAAHQDLQNQQQLDEAAQMEEKGKKNVANQDRPPWLKQVTHLGYLLKANNILPGTQFAVLTPFSILNFDFLFPLLFKVNTTQLVSCSNIMSITITKNPTNPQNTFLHQILIYTLPVGTSFSCWPCRLPSQKEELEGFITR